MGEADGEREAQPIDIRLLRTRDLIDLRLDAPGCTLEPTAGGAELVAGPAASLVIHFPPQHVGEQVWQAGAGPGLPPKPTGPSGHVAAGLSRLVFAVPEGKRIPYTLAGVLGAIQDFKLMVAPGATEVGESNGSPIEPPRDLETAIEAPFRLIVSPSARGAFRHATSPKGPVERPELWRTHLTVRTDDGTLDDDDSDRRIVRALWNRDREYPPPDFELHFPQALEAYDRTAIVDQTHGGNPENEKTPLETAKLSLSSLGAWFDWKQSWEFDNNVVDYRHQAFMGRDGYVRRGVPRDPVPVRTPLLSGRDHRA